MKIKTQLQIGMSVKILPNAPEYQGEYSGRIGVIESHFISKQIYGVKFDDLQNPSSAKGLFWFKKEHLLKVDFTKYEKEEIFMLTVYDIAKIRFLDNPNQHETFAYALYDSNIISGDKVVVKTGHHGLAVAEVVEIVPKTSGTVKYGREVIDKVNLAPFELRQEKAKRASALKKEMDSIVEGLQNIALYELLAEKSPELKNMLNEYKTLTE